MRIDDGNYLPLFANAGIFAVCFGLTALTPLFGEPTLPEPLRAAPEPDSAREPGDDDAA